MPPPPSEQQILALADRALEIAGPSAQVTAFWELRMQIDPTPGAQATMGVEFVCLERGIGRSSTSDVNDAGLRTAADLARRVAGADVGAAGAEPRSSELPPPSPGRVHAGWDPAVLALDPERISEELAARAGELGFRWRGGAARTAVVSSTGVRAFEQRSFVSLTLLGTSAGRSVTASVAAVGPAALDVDGALARIAALTSAEPVASSIPRGEPAVVLGPAAVAVVLDLVRPDFGSGAITGDSAVAERLGRRVVAPCINLSDSPRFPGTLPRSYDAEGLPRQPLPLVQDGVAHRVVRDTATPGGPSTGHATVALRAAPAPLHLVLVGGGAADEDELMRPIERGVFIPALTPDGSRALGAFAIVDGLQAQPLPDAAVEVDGIGVLAGAQALSMSQQLVPTADTSPRNVGASMCPALRASGGVTFRG